MPYSAFLRCRRSRRQRSGSSVATSQQGAARNVSQHLHETTGSHSMSGIKTGGVGNGLAVLDSKDEQPCRITIGERASDTAISCRWMHVASCSFEVKRHLYAEMCRSTRV